MPLLAAAAAAAIGAPAVSAQAHANPATRVVKPRHEAPDVAETEREAAVVVKPGYEATNVVKDAGLTKPERQIVHKIHLEEAKLRKRQARIDRLRALAEAQGNTERLAALDRLESRMHALHERKATRWRHRLGDEKFQSVHGRLARGRAAKHAAKHADANASRHAEKATRKRAGRRADTRAHKDDTPRSGKRDDSATFHGRKRSGPKAGPEKTPDTRSGPRSGAKSGAKNDPKKGAGSGAGRKSKGKSR